MDTVYAIEINPTTFPGGSRVTSIATILNFIVPMITFLASIAFLFMLLRAAFSWLTAGDNAESVAKAQKTMVFSILGILIVFFSYLGVRLIGAIFNISNSMQF